VVVILSDRSRSEPVAFVVEPARSRAWVAAPLSPNGGGRRIVVRSEVRAAGQRLVLTRPGIGGEKGHESFTTVDLAPAPAEGRLAVSVSPLENADGRVWVLVQNGRSLERVFADGEPHGHRCQPIEVPAGTNLVAALAGALAKPTPPPRGEIPADGKIRAIDEGNWPDLYVLLSEVPKTGSSRLVAVAVPPADVVARPFVNPRELPGRLVFAAAVPRTPTDRTVFALVADLAVAGRATLFSLAWVPAGLHLPARVADVPGEPRAIGAAALGDGSASVAVAVVE